MPPRSSQKPQAADRSGQIPPPLPISSIPQSQLSEFDSTRANPNVAPASSSQYPPQQFIPITPAPPRSDESPTYHFPPVCNPGQHYFVYPGMPSNAVHPTVLPQSQPQQSNKNLPVPNKKKTMAAKSKKKQQPAAEKRSLTDDNELVIIDYWKDHYELYGKSNKKAFASKAAEDLNREHFLSDKNDPTPISTDQLERLLAFWMKKYKKVSKQFSDSGFGLDEGDPQSIREHTERKMKHFYIFHSFLACKANVNPPVLLQTKNRNHRGAAIIDDQYESLAVETTKSDGDRGQVNVDEDDVVADGADGDEIDADVEDEDQVEQVSSRMPSTNSRILLQGSRKRRLSPSAGLTSRAPPRKKNNSGAVVADDEHEDVTPAVTNLNLAKGGSASGKRGSNGRNRWSNEPFGERKSSSSRLQIVDSMYASQKTQNEAQNESLAKTVAALENENIWRRRELEVLERSLKWQEQEKHRLDREEERKQREEERSKRDEKRRQLDTDSKMIIHRADQLQSQASMYKSLGFDDKALQCLKEADVLVSDLGKVGDNPRDEQSSR